MVDTRSKWEDELGRWLKPFLDRLGHKAQRRMVERGTEPFIPPRKNRKVLYEYDRAIYKQRNVVERMFCRFKDWRRIATRFDRNIKPGRRRHLPAVVSPNPKPFRVIFGSRRGFFRYNGSQLWTRGRHPMTSKIKKLVSVQSTLGHKAAADACGWQNEVVKTVIASTAPDPSMSNAYEERAACPLCESIGSGAITPGFSLPNGLEYHLRGTHGAWRTQCPVTAAAFEEERRARFQREPEEPASFLEQQAKRRSGR